VSDSCDNTQCQLAAKKNFVRYVSHEIRTPLNTVQVGIDLLTDALSSPRSTPDSETSSSEYKLDLCNDVHVACVVAVDMLDDLLLYDKIEEGNMVLEKTSVDFHALYRQTVGMFSVQVIP
jgi:signal transduction histidine kinase